MFSSILFEREEQRTQQGSMSDQSVFDLRIDQVFRQLSASPEWTNLAQYFHAPLRDVSLIRFRQNIMKDLESEPLQTDVRQFASALRALQKRHEDLTRFPEFQRDLMNCSIYLHIAEDYCATVESFAAVDRSVVRSQGIERFFRELDDYRGSSEFQSLKARVEKQFRAFKTIHFCLLIKDGKIKARPYEGQESMDEKVRRLFARFQGETSVEEETGDPPEVQTAHHVDAGILSLLSHWYPEEMQALQDFVSEYPAFLEPTLLTFADEICFYLDWLSYIEPLRNTGLPFCYPELAEDREADLFCHDGFDLALAQRLWEDKRLVVTNSFDLRGPERILVVTGPNQGGKTTFARFAGQCFYWAALGLCIPGRRAALRCFDKLYTHFGRKENLDTLNGKLQDDLNRLHDILKTATSDSIIIVNEIYSSTTLQDAVLLGTKMIDSLSELGAVAVCVTFLDELSCRNQHTVSMMSTVQPEHPERRSFQVIRKKADGCAYAIQLAQHYELDYESLKRRLKE